MESICGVVVRGPSFNAGICKFNIRSDEAEYDVISYGYQALKDNIFIEQGQMVQIQGELVDNTFFTKKSQIKLNDINQKIK